MKNSLLVHQHLIIRAEAVRPPVDEKIVQSLRKKINIASQVLGEELKEWI